MSEAEESRKDGKSGSPGKRVRSKEPGGRKSEVGSTKSEENDSATDSPSLPVRRTPIRAGTAKSEIKKLPTDPDSYRDSKLQTETMEIHHHPDLHHEKKNWKEYFLEFLMIFLAVTMGFIAETIRENISESGKAKELARSLYLEVYADSVTMQDRLMMRMHKEDQMEYFRKYVSDSSLTHLSDHFYPAFVWSYIVITSNSFEPNDGILNQLRNSGSLRYFKSIELQNCVSRITVVISRLRERNAQELRFVEEYARPFMLRHYDFKWQDEFTQNGKFSIIEALSQLHFHPSTPPYIKHLDELKREDAEGLTAYYLLITRASRQIFYQPYVEANHQLLTSLRKEYHFEKE
jgi:hypothetical protein